MNLLKVPWPARDDRRMETHDGQHRRGMGETWHRPAWLGSRSSVLITRFVLWKALLLLIVWACPGPGYDTSTSLLQATNGHGRASTPILHAPARNLVRWDAVYFIHIAQHGYRFEQEWAFGPGFPLLVDRLSRGRVRAGPTLMHDLAR